ncbi:hypothetical protein GCM10029978_002420 [Actinoallomurus acanthiterrae]
MSGKPWQTWSRNDSRILEAVLGLALLLVGLSGVLVPVLRVAGLLSSAHTREVQLGDLGQVPAAISSRGVTLRGVRTGELAFAHPGLAERLLLVLPEVARALLLLVILALLRRMIRSLRDGDVFIARNARRLGVIAAAVLVLATLIPLVDAVTTTLLVSGTHLSPKISITYEVSGPYVLLALLVAAAAEAFRQGTRLRADSEGLV